LLDVKYTPVVRGVCGGRHDGWSPADLRCGEQAVSEAFRRGIVDVE
jgi:hypothetical protein